MVEGEGSGFGENFVVDSRVLEMDEGSVLM